MPFAATWMDLEVKMLSEVRERNIWYHLYAESKKSDTSKLTYKKNRFRHIKQIYGYQREGEG